MSTRRVPPLVAVVVLLTVVPAAGHLGPHPQCYSSPPPRNTEGPPEEDGFWEDIVDLGEQAIHAIHLPLTGQILLWGYNGGATSGTPGKIYDPETGALIDVQVPNPAFCSGHTHLADGRVLIAGGQGRRGGGQSTVFDPVTMTFSAPVAMNSRRYYPTLTSLDDGRVFTASGSGGGSLIPEIYEPATDSWHRVGCDIDATTGRELCVRSRVKLHWYPRTVHLDGGVFATPASRTLFAQSLDLEGTETWTEHAIGSGPGGKMSPAPAVYYAPGRFLRAGADVYAHLSRATGDASVVDVSDLHNPTYRTIAPMAYARNRNNMTILADGTVLVTGGIRDAPCVPDADDAHVYHPELWDPATEQWQTLGPMQEARVYHSTAILLRDGSVLSAGGERKQRTAQIFRPPYLFRGARPSIAAAPAEVGWGEVFEVETPAAASIVQVNLIRLGAVTHAYDMSQRIARLSFTADGERLTVTAPADGYEAPPGYYMLFVVSAEGVPSIAEYVQVKPTGGYGGAAAQRQR